MEDSDTSPLLDEQNGSTQEHISARTSSESNLGSWIRSRARDVRKHFISWAPMYFCCLMVLGVDLPGYVGEAVRIRMYEEAICRRYYQTTDSQQISPIGDVPEELCKIRPVQSKLAEFIGWQMTLYELVGLVLVMPYGIAADVYGRKIILVLCMVGIVLSNLWTVVVLVFHNTFPVDAALFSTLFLLIGGGNPVIIPIILAMINDYVPEELRTRGFLFVTVVSLFTELTAPPIGSVVYPLIGPHLTFLITQPLSLLGLVFLLYMPETRKTPSLEEQSATSNGSGHLSDGVGSIVIKKLRFVKNHIRDDVFPMLGRPLLFLALMSLFVNRLTRPILSMFVQYSAAKFHWTIAKGNLLISLNAAIQLVMFLSVLPYFQAKLVKWWNRNTQAADLVFSRSCIPFYIIGYLTMGLAMDPPLFILGLCIMTIGSGYAAAIRSYMTNLVPKGEVAFLYTIVAIFEGTGVLVATPALAEALSVGIRLGGYATGLPFFIVTSLWLLSGVITWNLPLGNREVQEEDEAQEEVQQEDENTPLI